jgi:probable rRNA maturation factor
MNTDISIITRDTRWKGLSPTVRRAAEAVLAARRLKCVSLTVVLTDDAEIKTLNHQYRKKNKPTNVLSFPDGSTDAGVRHLGDVVMCYDIIVREADAQQKKLKDHMTHLTIHGVLHLLGFDHETEAEANAMESLEIKLLARMGIANPYESP